MACHEDSADNSCPIEDWCVCQWAFASYIHNAGGCDRIQEVKCEAINMEAVIAYRQDAKYAEALECIEEKCDVSLST